MTQRIAFQGEAGAFGEDALRHRFGDDVEACAAGTFDDVFAAVEAGHADAGVVPIENSLHGSVLEVYDLLLQHSVVIVSEVAIPIRHCLLGLSGVQMAELRTAHSHPQALAQCAPFLRRHGLRPHASYNTAGAARDVAATGDRQASAIASERAAGLYGLEVLARDLQEATANTTRFVVLDRPGGTLDHGGDKATLVFTTTNMPGALHAALGALAEAKVNLTRLESRPTRDTPWEYHFYLECGRADGAQILPEFLASVVEALDDATEFVRVLGVYPAATEKPACGA